MPLGAFKAALMGTAGVSAGADVVLLDTQTASDSASLDFTSGIDSTYGEYIFRFYNINPATDTTHFSFQCNATDSASYDETITSASFMAYHLEDDSATALTYASGGSLSQETDAQVIGEGVGNAADETCAGELHLFNPSSTTYVKQFYLVSQWYHASGDGFTANGFRGGYINTTTAIDDIKFYMNSGNFDGTIKMWGVK